ncbi:MAG: T9SS type A sorting domain-containing protein [Bacteroidales bacterium]
MRTIPPVSLLFLFVVLRPAAAQEMLSRRVSPPPASPEKITQKQTALKKSQTLLELPFYDDFSRFPLPCYPDQSLWSDSLVYINNSYPVNPPSVGVATFDAVNAQGNLYPNAGTRPFYADALTSRPINLKYSPSDNIYLSFYYQPQGLGEAPEKTDSLTLDFYAPLTGIWHRIWAVPGDTLQRFRPVILPVTDTMYLQEGFRFRFRNIASLSYFTDDPGRIDNDDHWHIDYVYLNRGRSPADTIPDDVAFVSFPGSVLKTYETIPWSHYEAAANREMRPYITYTYRNLFGVERKVDRTLRITGINLAYQYNFPATAENIGPYAEMTYNPDLEKFPTAGGDSALFRIRCWLTTDTVSIRKIYRWNDTVEFVQKFSNYYAWDDGSAEFGYGLSGQGAEVARLAYRFVGFKRDTLRAVMMYFNRALNDVNQVPFELAVWNNRNGQPGDLLYRQENINLMPYFDGLNRFHTYLLDEAIALPDTFYVGWIQTATTFLNVGFDVNSVHNNQIFYNINGTWKNSKFAGSLMIRPLVGKPLVSGVERHPMQENLRLWPNPASEYLHLSFSDNTMQVREVSVVRSDGRVVWHDTSMPEMIGLESFPEGLYMVVLRTSDRQYVSRFIILR